MCIRPCSRDQPPGLWEFPNRVFEFTILCHWGFLPSVKMCFVLTSAPRTCQLKSHTHLCCTVVLPSSGCCQHSISKETASTEGEKKMWNKWQRKGLTQINVRREKVGLRTYKVISPKNSMVFYGHQIKFAGMKYKISEMETCLSIHYLKFLSEKPAKMYLYLYVPIYNIHTYTNVH